MSRGRNACCPYDVLRTLIENLIVGQGLAPAEKDGTSKPVPYIAKRNNLALHVSAKFS